MELKQLFSLLLRWSWMLILGLALGVSAALAVSRIMKPVYQAKTKVLISRSTQSKAADVVFSSDTNLVQTYISLLTTKPIIMAVEERLNLDIDKKQIIPTPIPETQIIDLAVENESAENAAAIANTLIDVLIEQNDTLQSGRYAAAEESLKLQMGQVQKQMASLQGQLSQASDEELQKQLEEVDAQIATLQSEIATLQSEIATLSTATVYEIQKRQQLTEKQARLSQIEPLYLQYQQIHSNLVFLGKPSQTNVGRVDPYQAELQSTLTMYQQIYSSLLANLETVRLTRLQLTPNVIQVEKATVPKEPARPLPLLYSLFGGLGGLVMAASFIILKEHLDDTIKTPLDVQNILELPIVGMFSKVSAPKKGGSLYVLEHPEAKVSESFRSLRINIEFLIKQKHLKTFLITDVDSGNSKSMVAANLAAMFARAGKQVALVDANLRQPDLHKYFGIGSHDGLSGILQDDLELRAASVARDDISNLTIILGGTPVAGPLELLESDKMAALLKTLRQKMDIVIIVGPPMFVADMSVLASNVDGVLLHIRFRRTHTNTAIAALEQLRRANATLLGAVVSRVSDKQMFLPVTKKTEVVNLLEEQTGPRITM